MGVNILTPRGVYTTRLQALQAASNWYGYTIAYLPIDEGRGKGKAPVTSILEPDDVSILLGKVSYEPRTKHYLLWLYPKCRTFRYIGAGDMVHIAGKGWGRAILPNVEKEMWVCTHGIASGSNVKAVKKSKHN